MYVAELRGKLSKTISCKEDVLTSNVFSFFKYSKRSYFLWKFLRYLKLEVTKSEANEAKFIFWPKYDDKTEPDLVLIVGKYYILIESKYYSDFGENQLKKEADGGLLEAKNLNKDFLMLSITADYSEPKGKFYAIRKVVEFKWINWHFITTFLENCLKDKALPDRVMAEDLYNLLIKKNLRIFDGFFKLFTREGIIERKFAFFDYITAKYRGEFVGFLNLFDHWRKRIRKHKIVFFERNRQFFVFPVVGFSRKFNKDHIFWEEKSE
jgi:hypothetical protein